jgi:hypothetical protein
MKKKKIVIPENYLDRIPARAGSIEWKVSSEGMVTLQIENTGWANRLAQKVFGRPRYSYIHLDEMGSFVFPLINGERTVGDIAELVGAHFGEAANPLYERLAKYMQILRNNGFIYYIGKDKTPKA